VGDFDLTGRVAIITGGNSGIGLGMADALARAGCAISIWAAIRRRTRARPRSCVPTAALSIRDCATSATARLLKPRSLQPLLSLDGLTRASLTPGSVAGGGEVSSTAPRRSGGACSPSTSIACSTCFNLLPAT
jgi:NAD(P)-dependent dehydrogenase (short-subunit alcohol dehydrogenase family)